MRREESRTEARRGTAQRRWLWWVADAGPGDGGFDSIIAGRTAGIAIGRRRWGLNVGDDGWCWRVVEGCGGGEATALQENNQLLPNPMGLANAHRGTDGRSVE
jgi:hypothetical protein